MSKIDELKQVYDAAEDAAQCVSISGESFIDMMHRAQLAGIAAVVRAVRDHLNAEMPHWSAGWGAIEIVNELNEILGSDAGNEKVAGGPTSDAGKAIGEGGALSVPGTPTPATDFAAHLARQRAFSERTFGPGERVEGVSDHIRKELVEVAKSEPGDERQAEWIDVVMLSLDGAWRSGMSPEQIIQGLRAKLEKNERRTWPDWRTADLNKAIEHNRAADPAPAVCEWTHSDTKTTSSCLPDGVTNWMWNGRFQDKCPNCWKPIKFTEAK